MFKRRMTVGELNAELLKLKVKCERKEKTKWSKESYTYTGSISGDNFEATADAISLQNIVNKHLETFAVSILPGFKYSELSEGCTEVLQYLKPEDFQVTISCGYYDCPPYNDPQHEVSDYKWCIQDFKTPLNKAWSRFISGIKLIAVNEATPDMQYILKTLQIKESKSMLGAKGVTLASDSFNKLNCGATRQILGITNSAGLTTIVFNSRCSFDVMLNGFSYRVTLFFRPAKTGQKSEKPVLCLGVLNCATKQYCVTDVEF